MRRLFLFLVFFLGSLIGFMPTYVAEASFTIDLMSFVERPVASHEDSETSVWMVFDTLSPLDLPESSPQRKKGFMGFINTVLGVFSSFVTGQADELQFHQMILFEREVDGKIVQDVVNYTMKTFEILGPYHPMHEASVRQWEDDMKVILPRKVVLGNDCYTLSRHDAIWESPSRSRTVLTHNIVYKKVDCYEDDFPHEGGPPITPLSCRAFVEKYGADRSTWMKYQAEMLLEYRHLAREHFVDDCDQIFEFSTTWDGRDFPELPRRDRPEFQAFDWQTDLFPSFERPVPPDWSLQRPDVPPRPDHQEPDDPVEGGVIQDFVCLGCDHRRDGPDRPFIADRPEHPTIAPWVVSWLTRPEPTSTPPATTEREEPKPPPFLARLTILNQK